MMEIIGEGRRAVPSRPYPCGVLTVTVRCTECGYTRTLSRQAWRRSRQLCLVCSRPQIGETRDGWELIAYPDEGGRLYGFRCLRCGRTVRKPLGAWARPCRCAAELTEAAIAAGHQAGYSKGRALNRNSTSGVRGVCQDRRNDRWRAYITIDGRQIGLGSYADLQDAIEARRAGEARYFGERQNAMGLEDEYAQPVPEGYVSLTAWAQSHGRTKKAAQYHVQRGRVAVLRIGQTDYVREETAWPADDAGR